jgi:hypothetical protein
MALKIQNVTVVDDGKNGKFLSLSLEQNPGNTGASYLKVPFYTDASARDTALPSPEVGMVAFVGNLFMGYDGTKWDSVAGPALDEALTIAIMSL